MSLIPLLVVLGLTALCSSSQTEGWSKQVIQCAENESEFEFPRNLSNVNNLSIVLQCETVVLKKPLSFINITGLYFKGAKKTRITCKNSNILVENVSNLIMENIIVEECGVNNNWLDFKFALKIHSCNNVTLRNVTICNSNGTGMILTYNKGTVTIENSVFQDNQRRGLLIIYDTQQFVQITNCEFTNNNRGGLAIYLNKNKSETVIKNSTFSFNKATKGGGVVINYNPSQNNPVTNITFEECTFENNTAVEGGGILVQYNLYLSHDNFNNLSFKHCVWNGNSQAVSIKNINPTKKSLFMPEFFNCNFTLNGNTKHLEGNVFYTIHLKIKFGGITVFANNNRSALKAVSSNLEFEENSVNKFIENKDNKGGALHLIGNTEIWLNNNQTFEFRQNTAKENGGAIYVDSYKFLYPGGKPTCFLQLKSMSSNFVINVTFEGNHNEAGIPNDIHTVSLLPCLKDNAIEQSWSREIIVRSKISTAAHTYIRSDTNNHPCPFRLNSTSLSVNKTFISPTEVTMEMCVIPGKTYILQLQLVDEFCNEISFDHDVTHNFENSTVKKKIINYDEKSVTLHGNPHEKGKIQLTAKQQTNPESSAYAYIDFTIDHCPPGFVLDDNKRCTCGSSSNKNQFIGIEDCNASEFRAFVKRGYWVGYYPKQSHTQDTFASSICPEGFCQSCSNFSTSGKKRKPLPSNRSEDTSSYVCNDNRKGTMCGTCIDGHSAYYHSKLFSCKDNENCHLGWIFYILSEIIPVTILFLVIIFFNISFTSGPLNGVILSIQIVNAMKLNAEELIEFDEHIQGLSKFYRFFYQIFTLNFGEDLFSFCLQEGTSALDMLAFRYVTIIYSLFLVIATIFLLRLCSLNPRLLDLKRSIIHGLSAFLVMSYSECTRISISLITAGTLYTGSNNRSSVVFYNGDYAYMGNEHMKYALPAIFFLVTLVLIPPLLLLAYPLCYKVFALLKIEESKCVRITCKIIPLEKIKPLFDSMQGAFKDRYRFFAGMYFFYRLFFQVPFSFTRKLQTFYLIISGQLVFMLFLHGICRPYKNPWHNILDGVFFLLLNFINLFTLFNFQLWIFPKSDDFKTYFWLSSTLQCILMSLPLIYLAIYTAYCIVLKFKCVRVYLENRKKNEHENSDYILYELDTRDRRND